MIKKLNDELIKIKLFPDKHQGLIAHREKWETLPGKQHWIHRSQLGIKAA